MANHKVENLKFSKTTYPHVIKVANKLAKLEQRAPHNAVRLLIIEAGRAKIAYLQKNQGKNLEKMN